MIKITEDVYVQMAALTKKETCGIIAGNEIDKGKVINKFYLARNLSKHENKFRIGLWDKIKIGFKMLFSGCDFYVLFHVHDNSVEMSGTDVHFARKGSYNAIVCDGKVGLYLISGNKKTKWSVPIDYEIEKEAA